MQNLWQEKLAKKFISENGKLLGKEVAAAAYVAHLLSSDESLQLHGGGSISVKGTFTDIFDEKVQALYVSTLDPDEIFSALDFEFLQRLVELPELSDEALAEVYCTHQLDASTAPPPDALLHALLPEKVVINARLEAVLALSNLENAASILKKAFGEEVILLPYMPVGFGQAKAVANAYIRSETRMIIVSHQSVIAWGDTAREAYETIVELEEKAEAYLSKAKSVLKPARKTSEEEAEARLTKVAPILRGLLSCPTDDADNPWQPIIISALTSREILDIVDSKQGKTLALTSPLSEYDAFLIESLLLWIDEPNYEDIARLREQIAAAISQYAEKAEESCVCNTIPSVVIIPGLGLFGAGIDATEANIIRDIAAATLTRKAKLAALGTLKALPAAETGEVVIDHELEELPALLGKVALVTGAAGAIGTGICHGLLEEGCHVAVTDLAGPNLEGLVEELLGIYGDRVIGVALDVTNPDSVAEGFAEVVRCWGGLDIAIVNAGVAHVSPLAEMNLETFQRLERINVDGALLIMRETANLLKAQKIGGDIVLVSTKNVFAPGATFGAYSATKAAAHQLARIASQELAPDGIRVNMVAPDAVFSSGQRKSGLWQEVGPGRMKARGLDEKGLEEYYQSRNLLKAKVTAEHVANGVIFFVTHKTPTTGATIPIDGGLPDSTPR